MKIFTVLLLTVCCCLGVSATPNEFHQFGLQHLAQENGLANNTLLDIHQDKKGFLWLGTDVGISRYDGIHFHNYDLTNIEPRAVKRICEMEQDSLLWLKLDHYNEITCFDKRTGIYYTLFFEDEKLKQDIQDICIVDSTLYAITSNSIEQIMYEKEGKTINILPSKLVDHNYKLKKIIADNTFLYVLDEANNILIYNYKSKEKRRLDYQRINTQKDIANIFALNNHLWISTNWDGTYCYNPLKDLLKKMDTTDGILNKSLISNMDMKSDSVFIATTPHSILRISFASTDYINTSIKVAEVPFDNFMYDSFIKNRITKLYVDKNNSVVWLGTFGKGLLKSNIQDDHINRILLGNNIKNINGIAQDIRGYIWLTTNNNGVWRSNENKLSSNMKFSIWKESTPDGYYCMHKDESGNIWIGDELGNIVWMNLLNNSTITFQPKYDEITSVGSIQKLFLCTHNYLWLITSKGLFVYDYKNDKCLSSLPYNDNIYQFTSICEDGDGIIWLGTNNGVRSAHLKGNLVQLKDDNIEEKAGVSKGEVITIYANRYNQLYISYADKIIQTDSKREGIENVKILQKDMMSGHTECITDDKNGNTWMGNNMGIMTIHNKTKVSYTYPFPERFYSVCQLNDGQLLWSNSTGLMYFDPRDLKDKSPEELYISDLGVNYNKVEIGEEISGQVILKKPIYQMNELVLNHSNNNIVFYLTDFNYKQMPNKIEYRLLPYSTDWTSSYKAEIEFSNLPSGKYKLEVRPISINEENVPLTTLDIHIKKHWANTPLAYFCYLLLASLFAALTWYYIKAKTARKLRYKKKEEHLINSLEEEKKNRKEEEVTQRLRNQARYGLARELRTPLSLVAAPLKEMIADTSLPQILLPKVKVAYRNTISMQDVCNLMLNIYEQENEESTLKVAPYPIFEIVNSAISSSNELLNVAPIKLYYDKNNRIKKEIWVDRKKIEYIFRNILSNAYRHIAYSGNVHVKASVETIEGKGYCCFQVKDDGKNVVENSVTYTLNKENNNSDISNQLHSELGLFLMREHIISHHGDIRIEFDKEFGNCVTVHIPLGKEHFEGDANVTFIDPEETKNTVEEIVPDIVTPEEKEQQIIEENEFSLSVPKPNGKHKILVIEDHKDIRLYLKVLFGSSYTVIMAENGEEGVQLARKEMPDIILSDVMMPVMNGFECTRILKEDVKTCHIPIIMLTALVGDMDVVKGIELGADDYILKPFNPEILRSKVKRLIQNRIDLKQMYMKLMMANSTNDSNEQGEEGPKEDPFIRQIFDITEKNLQNPDFNVKRLAEMLNMSQPTLYRRVKMLTNYTIIELIRGVRLKRSAELLKTKKYSIQEVSEMVGYNDAPTFRKHFVDFYGTTPSTFANKEAEEKK